MQQAGIQQSNTHHTAPYASPKRKRIDDDIDMEELGRSPLRLRIDLPSRPIPDDASHGSSPRTTMTNHMQTLNLHQPYKQSHLSLRGKKANIIPQPLPHDSPETNIEPMSNSSHMAIDTQAPQLEVAETPSTSFDAFTAELEPPTTPTLKPTHSPQSAPATISPLPPSSPSTSLSTPSSPPIPTKRPLATRKPTPPPRKPSPKFTAEQLPPPSLALDRDHTTAQPSAPPHRASSPPPSSSSSSLSASDLVWTDAEITGHNPTDPADDGYGINGIGFRPTPAMAQARSAKRRQQVAEWKRREAGEARLRRAENRRRGVGGVRFGRVGEEEEEGRRVRFVEG